MINFRYHVVSLVAVFLSLGLGVLVGSSFIAEGTVRFLRATQDRLERTNDELKGDNSSLEKSVAGLTEFAEETRQAVVRGALTNRPVLILAAFNTPEDVLASAVSTIQMAGGKIEGVFRLSENLDGTTEARRRQIGQALETTTVEEAELRALLSTRMTETLSGQAPGMLARLVIAELADVEPVEGVQVDPATLPAAGTAIVVLGGANRGNESFERNFLLPIVRTLAESTIVAVGDPGPGAGEATKSLRREPPAKLVTVDGLSGPMGQVGLVLGLQAAYQGRFGHYGSGDAASSVLPGRAP